MGVVLRVCTGTLVLGVPVRWVLVRALGASQEDDGPWTPGAGAAFALAEDLAALGYALAEVRVRGALWGFGGGRAGHRLRSLALSPTLAPRISS